MAFQIDFFELMFLAERCIPPVPIARNMFFENLTNKYYAQMNDYQRKQMFEFITKNDSFNKENEYCQWFYARFNPENQYLVGCFHEGKASKINAFRKDDEYWTSTSRFINKDYIKSIEKI